MGYDNSLSTMLGQRNSVFHLSARLSSLSCSLHVSRDTSPYDLLAVMQSARRICESFRQAMTFGFASSVCLCFLQLFSQIMILPPIFTGYQMLWFSCVLLPIMVFAIGLAPTQDNVMQQMPGAHCWFCMSLLTLFFPFSLQSRIRIIWPMSARL